MMESTETLKKIAERVRTVRQEHCNLLRLGCAYAKEVGELLLQAKPFLGRQWGKWLAMEFDMTTECAYRYTTIAKYWKRIQKHKLFPNLGVAEMFDIARDRPIRKRSYKLIGVRLDRMLAIIDERLSAKVQDFPDLVKLMDAIEAARPVLEKAGLVKSSVESRKAELRLKKTA